MQARRWIGVLKATDFNVALVCTTYVAHSIQSKKMQESKPRVRKACQTAEAVVPTLSTAFPHALSKLLSAAREFGSPPGS